MKIFLLLISFFLSYSNLSHADWEYFAKSEKDHTYYIDYKKIKKDENYIYYWQMINLPRVSLLRSFISYNKGNCKTFALKKLSWVGFTKEMGDGEEIDLSSQITNKWNYPRPGSPAEQILEDIC